MEDDGSLPRIYVVGLLAVGYHFLLGSPVWVAKKSLPQPDPLDVLASCLFQSLSPATLLDVRAQIHCWNYGNIMKRYET